MNRIAISLSALLLSASVASTADDPVAVRQALMQANAASAGVAGGMLRGNLDFNPVAARAALATFRATANAMADFYVEQSDGDTKAAPAVWEDPDGFAAAIDKFRADAAAAFEAAGREGPADLAAFQQMAGPVLSNCSGCHETFRLEDN